MTDLLQYVNWHKVSVTRINFNVVIFVTDWYTMKVSMRKRKVFFNCNTDILLHF